MKTPDWVLEVLSNFEKKSEPHSESRTSGRRLLNTSRLVKWAIPWEAVPHSGAAGSGAAL
jgi:hypothetical protein